MNFDHNSKLYTEQSPTNLLDRSKDLAEIRELYEKIKQVEASIRDIQSTIKVVEKDANTIRNGINNFISNSSFLFSHRVYSMATFYNARYILSKWYGRVSSLAGSWTINSDTTESPYSVRSGYGFPPLPDYSWFFPGLTPFEYQNDWRFDATNLLELELNTTDPLNEKIEVKTEGFTVQVGKTIRLRGTTIAVPIVSTISGLVSDRTYWISSVETVGPDKFITLSVTEPPAAPAAPTNIKVFGTGIAFGYPYVEKRLGVGWEVEAGSLALSGGFRAATHLQEKKLRLADDLIFQCQIAFSPKFMSINVDSHNNLLKTTDHKLVEGTRVTFFNSESQLPGGLTAGTIYYVTEPTADAFKVKDADGNVIDLTSDGIGSTLARTVLNPDMAMKVSVWDNNKNRIFRGDRPVLSASKVGAHQPRVTIGPADTRLNNFGFFWADTLKSFYTNFSYVQPPTDDDFPPNNGLVSVYDIGNGFPPQLNENTKYVFKWITLGERFNLHEAQNSTSPVLLSSVEDGLQIGFIYQSYEEEPLVTRRYILEVVMQDERKFYSDPRTFEEGVNQVSDTVSPSISDPDNLVTINWSSVPGAVGYNIYRDFEGGGFYLLGSVPSSAVQFVDYGGQTNKLLQLPSGGDEYNEFFTAEVRIPDVTKEIFDTPNFGVKFAGNLKFPSIISDFETSGEQFLQIEFLRADGSPSTLADIPMYNILVDEVGLSYLAGNWSPSPRDLTIKPLPINPRIPISRGGRGERAEIPRSETSLPDLNDAIIVAYWLFSGSYLPLGALTGFDIQALMNNTLVRYSMHGNYSGLPPWVPNRRW